MWTVNVNDTQLSAIQKDSGVDLSEENIIDDEEQAAMPLPTAAAGVPNIEPDKARRHLVYTTQIKPASELVMLSQPR